MIRRFAKRKTGPVSIYAMKGSLDNIDLELAQNYKFKESLFYNLGIIRSLFNSKQNIVYVGQTENVLRRAEEHLRDSTKPYYFIPRGEFKVIYSEDICKDLGDLAYEEAEFFEKAYFNSREEYYQMLFTKYNIFTWTCGPFDERRIGKSQKEYPYPDNRDFFLPSWFLHMNGKDLIKEKAVEKNVILKDLKGLK